jgi:hypothetical protein
MKPTVFLVALITLSSQGIALSEPKTSDCKCDDYPFSPNPPCNDVCDAKILAIATEEDLVRIFGLSADAAKTISRLDPHQRPRSIESYRPILGDANLQELKVKLASLDTPIVRKVIGDAARERGYTIDQFDF